MLPIKKQKYVTQLISADKNNYVKVSKEFESFTRPKNIVVEKFTFNKWNQKG